MIISIALSLSANAIEGSIHALTGPNLTHTFNYADGVPFRTSLKTDVRADLAFASKYYSIGIYAQYDWTTESLKFNNTRLMAHNGFSVGVQMAYLFNDSMRAGLSTGFGRGVHGNGTLKYAAFEGSLFFRYDVLDYLSIMASGSVMYTGKTIDPSLQIGVGVPFSIGL